MELFIQFVVGGFDGFYRIKFVCDIIILTAYSFYTVFSLIDFFGFLFDNAKTFYG